MALEEYGSSPAAKSPVRAALNTSASFVLCGLVPLVSYLIAYNLTWCVVATGFVFFGIGAAKSRWSLAYWAASGLETLLIGMSAAFVSFLIGFGLRFDGALVHVRSQAFPALNLPPTARSDGGAGLNGGCFVSPTLGEKFDPD